MSITFDGVAAGDLGAEDFLLGALPVTNNSGNMVLSNGAVLPLSGVVNNSGAIVLNSAGAATTLELIQYGVTLQGGGAVTLSDSAANVVRGTLASVTLTNIDNTFSGAGQLGAGQMTLVNADSIVATGVHALVIDTGLNVVINTGTLAATGAGGLIVLSAVENTGLIWANGGDVTIAGAVTGAGDALISGAASMEFAAASDSDVAFARDAAGTLILGGEFTGVVSGFDAGDSFDFTAIDFGAGVTLDYAENIDGAGGLLTVTDGSDVVTVELAGLYDEASFHFVNDGSGGTMVGYELLV